MTERPQIGICIPVYYSGPEVPRVLDELLTSVEAQDYPQHCRHIFISVQKCHDWQFVEIAQVLNKTLPVGRRAVHAIIQSDENLKGPAMNTNAAIKFAGAVDYIKIMNQDDLLDGPKALTGMVDALENSQAKWLANACLHTNSGGVVRERLHIPTWPGEKAMVEGVNRIGCPSVVMFDASLALECDTDILYAMDCDMWIQLFRQAGLPAVRNITDVVIRMWDNQLTENLNIPRQLEQDKAMMRRKYGYT